MRQISSHATWWHKKVLPVFLFGILAFAFAVELWAVMQQNLPPVFLLVPVAAGAIVFLLLRKLVFPVVDGVWIAGDDIVVQNGGDEDSFPIGNIINVQSLRLANPERVLLTLREHYRFGGEVVFLPPLRFRHFGTHPIADELMRRANEADHADR